MEKAKRNLLIGSGLAVSAAAFSVGSYLFTEKMVETALERSAPLPLGKAGKGRDRLRGFTDEEAFLEKLLEGEKALKSKETVPVWTTSFDGTRLCGHWYPCPNPKRAILAMHGWRSGWARDFGTIADFWHESGCSVLFIEQRGQGESGGECMGFGLLERYDCQSWAKFLCEELLEYSLPVYLAGISMGAAAVLMASDLELPGEICGIIADCGFTSPYAIWRHVAGENLHCLRSINWAAADRLCRRKLRIGLEDFSAPEALRRTDIPVLFLHGTDDHFVPVSMTYENYKACASPKRLFVVPGADHGMSYYCDPEGYREAFKRFWREFDQ